MDSGSVGNDGAVPQAPPGQPDDPQNGPQAADSSSPTASTDPGAKTACAARWAALPAGLRERHQWVLAGADKSPLRVDGKRASVTDPSTWTDFASACSAAEANGLGIGYVLHESDPFTCIDLDVKDAETHPSEPDKWTTKEQFDRFDAIVQFFDSFTERSRSGKGLHVWVKGKIGAGKRRDGVEAYSQERFIICTGDIVRGEPIRERQQALDLLVAQLTRGTTPQVELEEIDDGVQDWYVASQAFDDEGRFKANELGRLFAGDWDGRYPSQSEADVTLVKMLGRYTESNNTCWSAFRLSELGKRDKAARNSYRVPTLKAARTYLADEALAEARGKEIADAMFWRLSQETAAGGLRAKPLGIFLQESEAIEFLIDDIYRRGWLYTITGATGAGKTGIAVSLALCIGSGTKVGAHETAQGVVLYIAGENPDDVRARFRATLKRGTWGAVTDRVHVIDQSFLLADRLEELEKIIDDLGAAVVFVDTDQAVSLSGNESENDNGVRMKHAKNLRRLTRRPSRPTVLDLCHPNGTATKDSLVPRGGSALLNEIDGNGRCWREDTMTTLSSDPNKHRGAAYELSFRKEDVELDEVKDTKGRAIPVPVFLPANDMAVAMAHLTSRNERQDLLKVIAMYSHMNQVGWLEQLNWRTPSGDLNKPKISRMLKALREADPPLVNAQNELTQVGKKAARSLV